MTSDAEVARIRREAHEAVQKDLPTLIRRLMRAKRRNGRR